jgi:hypothetical protein
MRLPPWQQSCDKSRRQAILHFDQNAAKLNTLTVVVPPSVAAAWLYTPQFRNVSIERGSQVNATPLPSQTKHAAFLRLGVPIACGIAIDYGSDLFKLVTRYERANLWFDMLEHLIHPSDAWGVLLALTFCVAMIALGTLAMEKWGDSRPAVKTALLIGSLTIIGVFLRPVAG